MCDELFHVALEHKTKSIDSLALNLGNKYFRKKKHFFALSFYNQLIAHAKNKKDLSLGFGNRSAVYFELKMYEECLQNIQWARENEYPEDKWPQINEREEKCREMLMEPTEAEEKSDPWEIFKLSYQPNKKIPWIVDCVEVQTTEKYGRGIYATRNLKAGDVICVEDLVVNFADKSFTVFRCFNCYKANALNLIPCDLTGHMMFCSAACRDDLYCKAVNIDKIVSVDAKILSDIAKEFGSIKDFDDYMLNTESTELNKTIFDFDFSNPEDPEYRKNLMICLLSLSTNDRVIGECSDIFSYVSEKAAKRILSVFNLNRKKSYIFVNKTEYLDVGYHVSLFASLVNHSCLNNAFTVLVNNKLVTVIQHPVKAGEQIFFNYISDTPTTKNLKRIEELHMFRCDCKLCIGPKKAGDMCLKRKITQGIMKQRLEIFPEFDLTDYDQVKEYLEELWKTIKDVPIEQKYSSAYPLYPLAMLDYVAGKIAYPFYD